MKLLILFFTILSSLNARPVVFRWDSVPEEVDGYYFYFGFYGSPLGTRLDIGDNNYAVIYGLHRDILYESYVTAHKDGVESEPSHRVLCTTKDAFKSHENVFIDNEKNVLVYLGRPGEEVQLLATEDLVEWFLVGDKEILKDGSSHTYELTTKDHPKLFFRISTLEKTE